MTAPNLSELNPSPCSVKTPQASWTVVNIGSVSILFSYERPAGVDTGAGIFVLPSKRSTIKHLNTWRDFRVQKEVMPERFNEILLQAIMAESTFLLQEERTK